MGSKGSGKVVVDIAQAERDPDNAFEQVLSNGTRLPMTQIDIRPIDIDHILAVTRQPTAEKLLGILTLEPLPDSTRQTI